ncbi:MAG: NirA family protein, partial [Xanthobacteraceae bacterium]
MSADFNPEQKRYLEGFASGLQTARAARGVNGNTAAAPSGPDAAHLAAQARFEAEGKKLAAEEKGKREEHAFDAYARLKEQAESGAFPKGQDVFRWKYHGLFYVAPAQDSFMCRLRIANGILKSWQFAS